MMQRVLLTGGTGFIGRHLVEALLDQPLELSLLVREQYAGSTPLPPFLAKRRDRYELVYADLRSQNLVHRAVQEAAPDTVLHLAAVGASEPFINPETAVRHNVTGTINLLRSCFEKGAVERLVITRTPGERTSMNPYAASKRSAWNFAEMFARTRGWPVTGAMIFQCYGAGQPSNSLVKGALRAARSGTDFPMTAGTQVKDWIAVEDVVAGVVAVVEADLEPGQTIELGTGIGTSVADVVKLIFELSASHGKPLVGRLPSRPGEEPVQIADADRTARLTGWRAKMPLRKGMGRLVRLND